MSFTPEQLAEQYLKLRAKKSQLADEHKAIITQYDAAMQAIENATLKMLQDQGVKSFSTNKGTAFQVTKEYVSLKDREALIGAMENGDIPLDIFTNAVSKDWVLKYAEANDGLAPPGVVITRETVVQFRKA